MKMVSRSTSIRRPQKPSTSSSTAVPSTETVTGTDIDRTPTKRQKDSCPKPSLAMTCIGFALFLAFATILGDIVEKRTDLDDERETEGGGELQKTVQKTKKFRSLENNKWKIEGAEKYVTCVDPSKKFKEGAMKSNRSGYLLIDLSGGLNQERVGIVNAVVVARILNATLIIPKMDHNSYWADKSSFEDIFDLQHFIKSLSKDVPILPKLPSNISPKLIFEKRVPRKSSSSFYKYKIAPLLLSKKVLRLTKFDFRLSPFLHLELQKLRCRVNYGALKFTSPIQGVGERVVKKLRDMGGHFLSVHIRYEQDMLAFSGCNYGGGLEEKQLFDSLRKRWPNLPKLDPVEERNKGKCLLSPHELALLLQALGYGSSTIIYIASGDIYGGEKALSSFKSIFPRVYQKHTLLSSEELSPFLNHSSQLAAIDYSVSLESDVFVANNRGNMARTLGGHRLFLGHKKTIRPNGKKLAPILMERKNISWDEFVLKVNRVQRGFFGDTLDKDPRGFDFFENPLSCFCNVTENILFSYEKDIGKGGEGEGEGEEGKEEEGGNGGREEEGKENEDENVKEEGKEEGGKGGREEEGKENEDETVKEEEKVIEKE